MFRRAVLPVLIVVLAACARTPDGRAAHTASAGQYGKTTPVALQSQPRIRHHAFAGLPDRGDLVAYPGQVVRHDGAYTWHRADLSEEHALHAIADGHLRVTAPDGAILDYKYDRHVEHPSGDWTWIGHLPGRQGEQAIITFGARAAFGSLAQPGKIPLRLAVHDGVSWLVETDPAKVAGIVNAATRPQKPDYFIAPKPRLGAAAGPRAMADAASVAPSSTAAVAAAATSTTTVDVVLGYTPGFVTENGGTTSAAVTRLNYLVDVANAAYQNAEINVRARLVATVAVSYSDATSNDSTLEQLTGYDSTANTMTTPNAAFDALRAARDQYGADLVSLVRGFQDPEHGGCGIAWLIGGGQTGISSSDEYFGYSVVSDGTDVGTDGKSYYCLDETLAHEMGHNMGAAHDRETSKGSDGVLNASDYGVFPYSFGYKTTATTGNFYTVMAYGDTGQRIYRIFSDPRSTFCGGLSCGSTDQADNARTLNQTMPIVAGFRAAIVDSAPPVSDGRVLLKELDTNGNGTSDLLLRNSSTGRFTTWFMAGTTRVAYSGTNLPVAYYLAGTGDFNGDHRTDLLWTSSVNDVVISLSTGVNYTNVTTPYVYSAGTKIMGVADINGNGKADILLRNAATGKLIVWYMDGSTRVAYNGHSIAGTYEFVGSGDLNKDGRQDLVWTSSQRDVLVSLSTGVGFSSSVLTPAYSSDYDFVGVTDVNGNGTGDLLFRSSSLGKIWVWFMDGLNRVAYSSKPVASTYRLVGKGDFNGDHRGDLVWADGAGNTMLSISTGINFSDNLLPYTYPSDYVLMDVR